MEKLLKFSPEVREALADGGAVLALESAMIANGIPYPRNCEAAHAISGAVRALGVVPAMIAVGNGQILVGMSDAETEAIAAGNKVPAIARRDLPGALVTRILAATTVSATMACARMAGIRVFSTGGLGGVHRGAAETYDVSADLDEFCRSRVAVVSSGAKAILDLPKTLEYLETRGIPVVGFGIDTFPAYYSRSSGMPVSLRLDTAQAVADLLRMQDHLMSDFGTLVCNPIPAEHELSFAEMELAIERALADANLENITGKSVTPYLLKKLNGWTGGSSLDASIALATDNARVGAAIALAYNRRDPFGGGVMTAV